VTASVLNYTAMNVMITDEGLIGKDLEGSRRPNQGISPTRFCRDQSLNMTHLSQDS
jgi:hypothetical protein